MADEGADIFTRAIALRGDARRQFLDTVAADAATVKRVRAMVDAYDHAPSPTDPAPTIETPPDAAPAAPFAFGPDLRETVGSMVGPYKILQEIGEGGFGFVYMAQQSFPIKRKVALKIVKPGMDTRQVIGRFEAERQALAMMDHPNIAKVFDAGATPGGRPYFVMELVKGVPITEYCDANRLSTDQRLELFIAVCNAVLHAHQKGIIHRDLKPSNVMVTLHDGAPVPKVIDFGISKATGGQELTDKTVFTQYRHVIGTPAYMSPEQAAMSGLDIDTRSDIYSLGVLLYELLTGSTPLDATRLQSVGYAEIQRIIQEDEPPTPSTRVRQVSQNKTQSTAANVATSSTTQTIEQIAKRRHTDAASLRKKLTGDLDWIVMRSLEKDRTRRYSTCADLAEDVRHYLDDEPIHARPPSTAYRLRKFARRNRAGLLTAGGALSALVLTIAALAYSYVDVRIERDKTAERETTTRAEMLLSTMNGVRKYTAEHVRPKLNATAAKDQLIKETVPAFSARQVFENIAKDPRYTTLAYKEASLNPTNASDVADEFEATILRDYRASGAKTDSAGVKLGPAGRTFWIARPMTIKDAKCLDCHTTPEAAPAQQVALYGRDGGYGWQVGETVAMQMVYVPVSEAFQSDSRTTYWVIGSLAGLFLLVMGGLVMALRSA